MNRKSVTSPALTSSAFADAVLVIYDTLFRAYGPQHWWPADSAGEVVIGAILTQNTTWTNVERAIENLRSAKALSLDVIHHLPEERLAELIRPSGTYRVKARRLQAFTECLWTNHAGSLEGILQGELAQARERLLAIEGIGPETADAILLYAGHRPTFVVDAYTKRVLRRHFLTGGDESYEKVRDLMSHALPANEKMFNEFHALFVAVGKNHCRTKAICTDCPLEHLRHDATL